MATKTPKLSVLAWNPGDEIVSRAALAALPKPKAIGSRHRPVPHHLFVETLENVLTARGLKPSQEQIVLSKDGSRIFGGVVVTPTRKSLGLDLVDYQRPGQAFALVYRSGNAGRVAIRIAAGLSPYVCSNLDIHGDLIALKRKHTVGLRLEAELDEAIERYVEHTRSFVETTDAAEQIAVEDDDARLIIFDAFERGLLKPRMFPHVVRSYFAPEQAAIMREAEDEDGLVRLIKACDGEDPATWTDCVGRNRRALHAAFTRAVRGLPPEPKLAATINVAHLLLPGDPRLN